MTWQDVAIGFELVILIGLYLDDHKMRRMAEASLVLQQKSLDAQEKYLAMRQKWYEQRATKKKPDDPKPA